MTAHEDPHTAIRNLLDVMAILRGDAGCPWDRKQTHRSLIPYLIEETYEVVDAVEEENAESLREELGDLLFQVVFHARIAEERGDFAFADVAADLAEKLRDRHPHVFAETKVESAGDLNRMWHERKMKNRNSALDDIPRALPALQQAAKVSQAAAHAGFEWNHTGEILAKAAEELEEFRRAVAAEDVTEDATGSAEDHRDAQEMELGDLYFALVQLARWRDIDPESALRRSTRKFMARFRWMESALNDAGQPTESQSAEEWCTLWNKAKAALPE